MEEQGQYAVTTLERCDMTSDAMSPSTVMRQVKLIQEVMREAMKEGEHYGVIPGCGSKPSLLKPGAEKLSLTFRLAPSYEVFEREMPKNHREYRVKCTLTHIPSHAVFGEGVGSCSTMEGKYRFRKAKQKCPKCGKETIIKGKQEYGGGWLCYKKKGGCGEKFEDNDPAINNQEMGRVEHDNPADYYNTVLKMAKKRAHVDATLTATAASDIFTQDVEDMEEVIGNGKATSHEEPPPETKPKKTVKKEPPKEAPKKTFAEVLAELKAKFVAVYPEEEWLAALGSYGWENEEQAVSAPRDQQLKFYTAMLAALEVDKQNAA